MSLADLLYPPLCLLCSARLPSSDQLLCSACALGMRRSTPPVCLRCGVSAPGAFDAEVVCAACRQAPPVFAEARAPWQYTGTVPAAIHQFKYRRRWRLGRWLAETMTDTAKAAWPRTAMDAIVPVPRHWLKVKLRGCHPAGELASRVAQALGLPCHPRALRQAHWTRTQTRLEGAARHRNVRRAFTASARLVRNRRLLLVDDVLTSGATANACARTLKEAGAAEVFVLTAARTPRP